MYKLVLTDQAQRVYAKVELTLARKLARCFARLERSPRSGNNVKPLRGAMAGHYRYRVGDHRVVYCIDDVARTITVVAIAHRRDVYE